MNRTKSALLLSALSVLVCVAMLVGTTFAWFTDTASTGVNKIQSGNIDVEIVDVNGDSVSTLAWVTADGRAQDDILWEPGATYALQPFKVKNAGNLVLKYKFVIEGLVGDAKLLEAIDFTYTDDAGAFDVDAVRMLGAGESTAPITISGKMKNEAGNEYQGLSIDSIKITVVATQAMSEYDSIDNDYDENATLDFVTVRNTTELVNVLKEAKAGEPVGISLDCDVSLDTFYLVSPNTGNTKEVGDVVVQANGREIATSKTNTSRAVRLEYSDVQRNVTLIGAKIKTNNTTPVYNEDRGVAIYDYHNSTITLKDCVIECVAPQYTAGVRIIDSSNLTINIVGCTITASNPVSLFNSKNCVVNITDCVLISNYEGTPSYLAHGIYIDPTGTTGNVFNVTDTTFRGEHAAPYSDGIEVSNTVNETNVTDETEKKYRT